MKPATANGGRLRVLHIVQNLNYGGMERLLFEMLRRSDRDRFDNHVLVLEYIGRFGEGMAEFAKISVSDPMGPLSLIRPAGLTRSIARIRPDVVHTHSGVWHKGSIAARSAGVPWRVHTEHGRIHPNPLLPRIQETAAARRTNAIVAVSETVADRLRTGVWLPRGRLHVITNGVDVDAFLPRPDDGVLRRELGLPPAVPVIGSIGRLEPVKGYEVMVDAYAILLRRWSSGEPPVLAIAGDGSERAALESRAAAAGVGNDIRWLGWRDDIQTMHSAFVLFTMSSHSEGTSISLLEAMSAGLCPVVTDVGGNGVVLGEELRHRLVAAANPEALASSWESALRDDRRREADGRAARARVREAFGLERMVREYEAIYQRRTQGSLVPGS